MDQNKLLMLNFFICTCKLKSFHAEPYVLGKFLLMGITFAFRYAGPL